jgi:hypothetical protein
MRPSMDNLIAAIAAAVLLWWAWNWLGSYR